MNLDLLSFFLASKCCLPLFFFVWSSNLFSFFYFCLVCLALSFYVFFGFFCPDTLRWLARSVIIFIDIFSATLSMRTTEMMRM